MKLILATLIIGLAATACSTPEPDNHRLSPDGQNLVVFELIDGVPHYSIGRNDESGQVSPVVLPSKLGFELGEGLPALDGNFSIENITKSSFDETWTQVWGEKQNIRNNYNELRVDLVEFTQDPRRLSVVFRVYDDGVGFRYEFPEQENLGEFQIIDELTEFQLAGDHTAWWIGAYQWNRFEYYFQESPLSAIDTVHTPLTMRTNDDLYLSFHEAALVDYSTMTLEHTGNNKLKANLMPWQSGVTVYTAAPMVTPWRTLQISDTPGGLITSYLILNLNEPNKIEDTSWIEPAKYVGIWWEMHLDKSTWGSGDKHGATTENTRRYIDFAAEHGFPHVLVEGWNPGWDGEWYADGVVFDFTEPMPNFDLEGMAQYALDNGVRLMGHHETSASVVHYEAQMHDAFALYERLGVRAVKSGYVGHGREIQWFNDAGEEQREWHHGQYMVRHHQAVVELAAQHKISLNVHEGLKDTGLRRTWPNLMTREVAKGQEYNAWGSAGGNPPSHTVLLPFTRNLAGPFDYTPGVLDLYFDEYRPDNRIKSTLAKELALYVVIYSPLHMAADLPENYARYLDAFQVIKDVPVDWYDTRILDASIGEYITTVRKDRNSDDWYLGSITGDDSRDVSFELDFLDRGATYTAQIYRDGPNADWEEAPYDFVIEEIEVTSADVLDFRIGRSGGVAIRFARQ
ncbi:MAG: glycoside hydrolase family 97 protein [Balneolales bacterium]|nr:glycoside hydrolase family 97 protein [Balneolales bacterium]